MEIGMVFGLIGAVIAFGCSGAGSAVAMSWAGQAAAGVVKEDSRKFGQTLVLQAMGSTNGIYGLLLAFLVIQRSMTVTDANTGLWLLFSCVPMGVVGLVAAMVQGKALVSGIMLIGKKSGELSKALIYAAMIETYAIFALLISFIMYSNV
ncbi:MAG: V-type ATP synthase subunit K [Clostridiales bacterium]|nr:V-type ATP synthase subunit K [Clostridiales bacterium]